MGWPDAHGFVMCALLALLALSKSLYYRASICMQLQGRGHVENKVDAFAGIHHYSILGCSSL